MKDSCIYFVRLGNVVKIGFTVDLEHRLKTIPGRLVTHIPGGRPEEARLHWQFRFQHEWREWFRIESPLTEYLASLPAPTFVDRRPGDLPKPVLYPEHSNDLRDRVTTKPPSVTDYGPAEIASAEAEIVTLRDIATRFDVMPATVAQWRKFKVLPVERWVVDGRPCWNWPDIQRWAAENSYPRKRVRGQEITWSPPSQKRKEAAHPEG